jgi:hypothetical protein
MWELAIEKAYPEYDHFVVHKNVETPKYFGACVRFLYDFRSTGHKCWYITDIDMMIVREPVSILDFHIKEMQESGLCYSNSPRGTENQGPERLTGLHFVGEDWWTKTAEMREKYYLLLTHGHQVGKTLGDCSIDDELMLMKIVKESGLPVAKPVVNLTERHHGLHLGTIRAHKKDTIQSLRRAVSIRVNKDKAIAWQGVVGCSEYSKILSKIQKVDRIAYEEFMTMDKFTKQIAKG